MTTWSSVSNGLQVGVDLSTSDGTPFFGESITITCKWYVKSANRWNDTETLHWSFDGSSGTKSFNNTVDGSSQLIQTKTSVVTANNSAHSKTGHGDITGAYNGATPSISDSITVPAVSGAPDPPTGLSTSGITSNAITLSWSTSVLNGSAVSSYTIAFETVLGSWSYRTPSGTATSYTITGLTPNTGYNLKVLANSTAGSSAYSSIITRTTAVGSPDSPSAVSIRDTSTVSTFQTAVSWTRGASNGSSGVTFDILVSRYASGSAPFSTTLSGTLSTSGTTTSLPVAAMPVALAAGDTVSTVDSTRAHAQVWTLTAPCLVGDTALTVSDVATFAFPTTTTQVLVGSLQLADTMIPSANFPALGSTLYHGWVRVASTTPGYVGGWVSGGTVTTGASGGAGDLVDRALALAAQLGTDMAYVDANTGSSTTTFAVSGLAAGAQAIIAVTFPTTLRGTPRYVGATLGVAVAGDTGLIVAGTSGYSPTGFNVRVFNASGSSMTLTANLHVVWLV